VQPDGTLSTACSPHKPAHRNIATILCFYLSLAPVLCFFNSLLLFPVHFVSLLLSYGIGMAEMNAARSTSILSSNVFAIFVVAFAFFTVRASQRSIRGAQLNANKLYRMYFCTTWYDPRQARGLRSCC
jgi:hypothetical protein